MAELIRRALDKMLAEEPNDAAVRQRATESVGFVRSDTGDLSVEHDHYLAEAREA